MPDGYSHASLSDLETNPEKPGSRWELSPALGIEDFNVNVAVLEPGERLSQSHYHYHEDQQEFFYVATGACRAEVPDGSVELSTDDVIVFDAGEPGAHVLYNPTEEPCKLVAIGWPPEGRHPVHQLETLEERLAGREE